MSEIMGVTNFTVQLEQVLFFSEYIFFILICNNILLVVVPGRSRYKWLSVSIRKISHKNKRLVIVLGVVHKLRRQYFGFFFDHITPSVDIFYLMKVDKKSTFLNYLPPSSCKRSLWTTPIRIWKFVNSQRKENPHDLQ